MKVPILNESHLDATTVGVLVDFAASRCEYSDMAYVHVRTKDRRAASASDGRAFLKDPTGYGDDFLTPSRIEVDLVDRRKHRKGFPHATRHPEVPKAVGWVTIFSPEEEFLFIVAHEFQHISDFWNHTKLTPVQLEARAEKKALKVLRAFRLLVERAAA